MTTTAQADTELYDRAAASLGSRTTHVFLQHLLETSIIHPDDWENLPRETRDQIFTLHLKNPRWEIRHGDSHSSSRNSTGAFIGIGEEREQCLKMSEHSPQPGYEMRRGKFGCSFTCRMLASADSPRLGGLWATT